jgi:hypothetical protein
MAVEPLYPGTDNRVAHYDPAQLEESSLMQIRLRIGDVGPDFLMDDRELEFFLSQNQNEVLRAALEAVISIVGMLTGEGPKFRLGPYSEDNTDRINFYMRLRRQLEQQLSSINAPLMRQPTTPPIFGYDMMSPNNIKWGGRGYPFDESPD